MKSGIITYHFVNNYGGALQAYALRRYMADNFCADTEVVDYRHWFIRLTDAARMFPITTNARYYGPWFRAFPKMLRRRRKFAGFIKREDNLSKRADFPWQLKSIGSGYRLLICGSDQIWNPFLTFGLAKAYFLRFAPPGCRRISYAASTGGSTRSKDRMLGYIRDLDAVSIRENVDWIEGSEGLSVEHHIDPTMLLTRRDWEQKAVPPKSNEKYILTYFMQMSSEGYSVISKIKAETGYKVYDISRYGYKPDCVDESLVDIGPEEFVGLFQGAQHVCTNSFHGMVFALNFDKTVDYIPIQRFGGRIEKLIELLHMKKVPAAGGAYFHIEYDPDEKNRILEAERRRAYSYLEREVKLANGKV